MRNAGGMTAVDHNDAERAARQFADRIVDLVGADAEVTVETPEHEFDVILRISPRKANAVHLEVMIFGAEQIVVWAHRPALGWWTFDEGAVAADAWAVIEQIVNRGGQVVVEKRGNPLRLRYGTVRLHGHDGRLIRSMDDGGAGPWKQVTTFPSYRQAPRDDDPVGR